MWWHGGAREGKWRGNWRMQCVASTLHTTSEHGVSSITTADAHTSAVPVVDWTDAPAGWFKWSRPFRPKDEIWFLRVRHHISNAVYKPSTTTKCISLLLLATCSGFSEKPSPSINKNDQIQPIRIISSSWPRLFHLVKKKRICDI